jgi:hypothetical protein
MTKYNVVVKISVTVNDVPVERLEWAKESADDICASLHSKTFEIAKDMQAFDFEVR